MAVINATDISDGNLDGDGVFDVIMLAATSHLQEQFDSQRINKEKYAEAYIAITQTAIAQSISFILQKQTADKQAELLAAQELQVDAQTAKLASDKLLVDAVITTEAEKTNKLQAEIALLNQKKLTEEAQVKNTLSDSTVVYDGTNGYGAIGIKNCLYNVQKNSFEWDGQQKLLNSMINNWGIYNTNGGGATYAFANNGSDILTVAGNLATDLGTGLS